MSPVILRQAMAKPPILFSPLFINSGCLFTCILLIFSIGDAQDVVVFQPTFLTATGPLVSVLLLGNSSEMSLSLTTVSPSNTTGSIGLPSCISEATNWMIVKERVGKTAVQVQLKLEKNLRLCAENETNADCCPSPLCVLETLQVSACEGGKLQASLLVQVKIYGLLVPTVAGSDNKTTIPNQVYQPLGSCPCDLTFRDCSTEDLKLFLSQCLLGPFGGQVPRAPDYQCSVQLSENSPNWFPFLCVNSPLENNPHLGLFYQGGVITSKPGPSFHKPMLSAPVPVDVYIEGSPVITNSYEFFTIPQKLFGQCINNAPVGFLKNFETTCVSLLHACPTAAPFRMLASDLRKTVKSGEGSDVTVEVTDELITDLSQFITGRKSLLFSDQDFVCENVTLAMDYQFFWKGNGITSVNLTRSVGTISFNGSVALTTSYSAVFLNGEVLSEPNSGNPGYQDSRPVIGGTVDTSVNDTVLIQRTSINLWKSGSDGLCSNGNMKPVLYGENSTSGCLLSVSKEKLTQCDLLRESISSLQKVLNTATHVAKSGNPDSLIVSDWENIIYRALNLSNALENNTSSCDGIPSHQHIHVQSLITSTVDGITQRSIFAVQISYSTTTWTLECRGGNVSLCVDPSEIQLFPISSSVTFTDVPITTRPPKTRFQINFTEYDCNRNDVCWPELAFPITRYYTGEPYSQALAKGLILVFFFLVASVLGNPWRQIRQSWNSAAL
ncbi:tectonic-2 isoform X2 [Cynoglossus semilaevis]|uniref:tectonic-2 isoform X2 n=1 Tax=Cynoglossus semilaevis TaxID=244447 RepID=UPI000D62A1F8|nr:tectonic-2 isoform X2 [Cynoglossus semilaevis]